MLFFNKTKLPENPLRVFPNAAISLIPASLLGYCHTIKFTNSALLITQEFVIGLDGSTNPEPRLDAAARLGRIAIPVLDIYAERDYPNVVRSAKRRYRLSRQGIDKGAKQRPGYGNIARDYTEKRGLSLSYRQIKVSGADHHFSAHTTNLEKRLRGWLDRYAAGIEIE